MPLRLSGSTGVSGIDGTAQAPAIQGTNPNAGIYYSGNNVIVSTSGNTALTVGPSGNVAISNSFSISGQYVTPYSGMMKNRIINGDFKIDQRFAGAANTTVPPNQYVVDRWWYAYGGFPASRMRFQQNNTNGPGSTATQTATGFPYYFGANVVTSNTTVNASDYLATVHCIEGLNIADLGWGTSNASPVTLSFWTYSSVPGNYGGSLRNANTDRSYPFSYNIGTANTWQYQTITIPGDTTGSWWTNNNIGITLVLNTGGVGSTYSSTAGSWQAGSYFNVTGSVNPVSFANGAFYLTGVQLEKGSQATAFEFRHYTTELQLCQRYYHVISNFYIEGYAASAQHRVSTPVFFPVAMRTTPNRIVITAGSFVNIRSSSTSYAGFGINGLNSMFASVSAESTSSGWMQYQNGSEAFSAELSIQN